MLLMYILILLCIYLYSHVYTYTLYFQAGLRDHWNRDDMTEADKFLKDYILEKRYLVDDPEAGYVFTFFYMSATL